MSNKKYYIKNSAYIQELRTYWEAIIGRFTKQINNLYIQEDMEFLEGVLKVQSEKALPKEIKIVADNIEKKAMLCDIDFHIQFNKEGNIIFDFVPSIHALGMNLKEYTYAGVLD